MISDSVDRESGPSLILAVRHFAYRPGANVSELCREFGISRQTGHKWIRRYRNQDYLGLVEQKPATDLEPMS